MEGYPWIKLYRDIGEDSKIKRLTSDEFMLWIIMMTKANSEGFLFLAEDVPYNSDDLSLSCNNFRKSIDDGISIVETALKKFASMKMISIGEDGLVCLLNFKLRQERNLSEAERQAKSRENKKNRKQEESCHADVTTMSQETVTDVTVVSQKSHPKIEDIRLKNKELENTNTPPTPPRGERVSVFENFETQNREAELKSCSQAVEAQTPLPEFSEAVRVAGRRKKNTALSHAQTAMFEQFWSCYPKRRNRTDSEKAWLQLKPDEQLFAKILQGLERAKTSADWQKECGQFIPYPASWLRGKRWEDEDDPQTGSDGYSLEAFERYRKEKYGHETLPSGVENTH